MYNVHTFLCALYVELLCPLIYLWYATIIPMYNVHPYFSLQKFGQQIVHYTWQNMARENVPLNIVSEDSYTSAYTKYIYNELKAPPSSYPWNRGNRYVKEEFCKGTIRF